MDNNRIIISIPLEPHLKDFVLTVLNQKEPVFFKKRDKIHVLIKHALIRTPPDYKPVPDNKKDLKIILPYYMEVNINVFNHLSTAAKIVIAEWIEEQFQVTFIRAMNRDYALGIPQKLAITIFIDRYKLYSTDVNGTIYDRLRKSIYRTQSLAQLWPKRSYNEEECENILSV